MPTFWEASVDNVAFLMSAPPVPTGHGSSRRGMN